MEPKFQSSFIPKGSLASTAAISMSQGTHARHSIIAFAGGIIFAAALIASVGVFGYKWYLDKQIAQMDTSLTQALQTLDAPTIDNLTRLNSRIDSTKTLINQHTVMTPFFDLLEHQTVQAVSFTDFDFTTNDKGVQVTLKGMAKSYATVAYQSQVFESLPQFQNVVFSDLALDAKGNVTFTTTFNINPKLLSYTATVATTTAPVLVPPTQPATTTPVKVMATSTPKTVATSTAISTPKKK